MNMKIIEKKIYSVTELNRWAKEWLESGIGQIQVTGEISNLMQASSGHAYFSLKDAQAQVRCALFRMNGRRLNVALKNGLQVTVWAQVSLYEARGDFQLIVQNIEASGDGLLQKAFENLKKRLSEAGLFSPDRKKPLPSFPKMIGVITSAQGAAIHDILSVLKKRFAAIPVIIYPTLVQGEQAASQIVKALQTANQRRECDVLILARGGGSLEDLWPFNEEIVAHAIAASEIPIITGIGHEVDFTIADFTADVRAPTPSAAAEHVSPDKKEWLQRLIHLGKRLSHLENGHLDRYRWTLQQLTKRLKHPGERLQAQGQQLDRLEHRLLLAFQNAIEKKQRHLQKAGATLHALSPLHTLERGYAIIQNKKTEQIISKASALEVGDDIIIKFSRSYCECEVKRIFK